jgi:glycosyltransferase involved in cell wall biosynthesis
MRRVLMGLSFFPRGGSAHVARNLARHLPAAGWDATVLSGSLSIPGRPGDARDFYRGVDVRPVDMTAALGEPDPMVAEVPLHPSFEDRPGAPDRIFASLDDAAFEHHTRAWARALADAGADEADVLHLHHLTPINAAAAVAAPGVPVVGHVHGTELLMLEAIEADPRRWAHGEAWAERLREWAAACERLIVLSDSQVARAERLLGTDPERCVQVSNGFDPDTFRPREVDRMAVWRRVLVDDPRGWAPGEEAGSVRYDAADLEAFEGAAPVLLYVGRYTEVKRLNVLIEAHARAGAGFSTAAPLVLVGGFPGEWEGEHPLETIARVDAQDVFLAGWHDHEELPDLLGASDVVVLASVREQFGQVLVEGMACGLPAIAVDAHGPAEIVRHGETGWLVPPDDVPALANALVHAVNCPAERARRAAAAAEDARARFAWPALAARVADVYATSLREHRASTR